MSPLSIGEIAGIVSSLAYILYIIAILNGKTKPSRSTWWVLTAVGILILATSYSIEAKENTWIQLVYIMGPLAIALLSLFSKFGYKSGVLFIDKVCLAGAGICIAFWLVFHSPFIALVGSIAVDFIGLIPTIKKAYIDSKEESPFAWSIEFFASIINAIGISSWFTFHDKNWIYALYLLLSNGLIVLLLWRSRLPFFNRINRAN